MAFEQLEQNLKVIFSIKTYLHFAQVVNLLRGFNFS